MKIKHAMASMLIGWCVLVTQANASADNPPSYDIDFLTTWVNYKF